MPREQINYPQPVETHSGSISEDGVVSKQSVETHTEPAVHVTWYASGDPDAEGHVQIVFEADPSYFKSSLRVAEDGAPAERPHMYSPPLVRSEINRLIRVLKRARDQAYGRDE